MSDYESKSVTMPKWDGKADTCARYITHIQALAEYHECGDALDETEMVNCPTKTEYMTLKGKSTSTDDEKEKINLYKANKRMTAIMTLGQSSDHGISMIERTKSDDFPSGLAYKVINAMKLKNKPKDTSAEISLDADLDKVEFSRAEDYYNDVVAVCSRYDVSKTETDLVKQLAKKVTSSVYAKMIIDHLDNGAVNHSLEKICEDIRKIQRLTKANGTSQKPKGKEVQLANADVAAGSFKGICGYCGEKCGYKRKDCPKRKNGGSKGGGAKNSDKTCNYCGKKGHIEADCWKKHPEKVPDYIKKKNEGGGASVEVMLMSLEDTATQDFANACL